MSTKVKKEASSFKDPDGFLYYENNEVYRQIVSGKQGFYKDLLERPILKKLMEESKFVQTESIVEGGDIVFKHERLELVTYPYDWSILQFIDAACFTLDFQIELLNDDLCLKDASPYNVLFKNNQAIFVDLTSIIENKKSKIWLALNQFLENFFYPIIINYEKDISHSDILKSNINGINAEKTERILGKTTSHLKYFIELALPRSLNNKTQDAQSKIKQEAGINNNNQQIILSLLKAKLVKIRKNFKTKKMKSAWASYTEDIHYGQSNYAQKQEVFISMLEKIQAKKVLDLGSNNGDFSFLAETTGREVISIDFDPVCISHIYEKAKEEGSKVTAIQSDLSNPSASIGWRNLERKSLLERLESNYKANLVLALALLHHLLVTSRIPLEEILKLLHSLTNEYLIIEFIKPEDEKFQQLLSTRENIYNDLSETHFEEQYSQDFTCVEKQQLTQSRTLYLLKKKTT